MQLKDASILVVDDEPVLLDIMSEWFKSFVARVHSAADGGQALEILSSEKINLVITDVRMPVMDGITLLRKIKAGGAYTPSLIFVTGFADIHARDAYDLGAQALLEKPIERDDLIEVAQHCLCEPGERWSRPRNPSTYPVLRRRFKSLAQALQGHEIAFGRGGFCIESSEPLEEGPMEIELDFKADSYVLSGQGIVRWLASRENQVGVELTYVAEPSRAHAIELTENATAFIPRSTGRRYQALAG
jgi:CheY-like chemotaxis protein